MASPDILTLSSSPPRLFRAFHVLSSPALPSPSTLFTNDSLRVQKNNGLAPVADSTTVLSATKSTAATLLSDDLPSAGTSLSRNLGNGSIDTIQLKNSKHTKKRSIAKPDSVQEADGLAGIRKKTTGHEDISRDGTEVKKSGRKNADGEPTESATGIEKKARKSRSKKVDELGEDGIKARAVRKPRTKKADEEAQAKFPKSRVTKHSIATDAKTKKDKAKSKRPELVSKHFSTTVEPSKQSEDSSNNGLLEAVKRRTCWTPPKPTVGTTCFTTPVSDVADDVNDLAGSAILEQPSRGFSDLFGNFAFSSVEPPVSGKKTSDSLGTRKRRLIEMVTTNISTSNLVTATTKSKAPKKKARTITDQATSAYSHDEELPTTPAPLLQYFSRETTNDGFKIPPKPRTKSPVKVSSKRGNGTAQAPILLSPGSALKQVGNQDFVFGTSSQLAREQSPTLLRDIHTAMQASNEINDGDGDPFKYSFQACPTAPIGAGERPVAAAKRNLWSAAARDTTGKLLDVEMIDLAVSPAAANSQASFCVNTTPAVPVNSDNDGAWRDIEELLVDAALPETIDDRTKCPQISPQLEPPSVSTSNMKNPELSPKALRVPQPSDTIPRVTESSLANIPSTTSCDPEKPDYLSYTSVELAKEIASYRFKPVKNRNHMITLLERCWEGKRRTALGSLEANAMIHSSSNPPSKQLSDKPELVSPKRPTGRPKKTSTSALPKAKTKKTDTEMTSTVAQAESSSRTTHPQKAPPKKTQRKTKNVVDEISDSDSPLTPSPPRRRLSQIRTPPLQLLVSATTVDEETPALSQTSSREQLFEHITRAVTTAPPSKNPSHPSWHEKILLYDPIILEDLTVWLNTGALEKAGWDGEVHPGEVKKWCVSKSICCLWKENLRGGVRTRF